MAIINYICIYSLNSDLRTESRTNPACKPYIGCFLSRLYYSFSLLFGIGLILAMNMFLQLFL